jgi:tetrahydromethanopterin S-methyltransferase subunit A
MFDKDEKPNDYGPNVIELEEKPKTSEQEDAEFKEDFMLLKRRVIELENEMKIVKEKLKRLSFTPGL